jgi:hypothetical protein
VASEGTCALRSQPRIRRNHLADTRSARDGASRAFELATTNFKHASDFAGQNANSAGRAEGGASDA